MNHLSPPRLRRQHAFQNYPLPNLNINVNEEIVNEEIVNENEQIVNNEEIFEFPIFENILNEIENESNTELNTDLNTELNFDDNLYRSAFKITKSRSFSHIDNKRLIPNLVKFFSY